MSKLSYQNIIHSKPGDSYCSYESPGLYDYLYGIMLARRVCDEQTEKASRLCVLAPMPLCIQRGFFMYIIKSIFYFLLAGLFEIGGGYLIWQWLREGKSLWYALAGAIVLILYGIVPTLQPEGNFGKIYAAYGGIFIVMSLLWGWRIDDITPDRYDIIGAAIALIGVGIIMYWPRG